MKKTLLLICLFVFGSLLYGQNTKNLKIIDNSEKIIRKGIKTADQGKFDDAIALYNQVPYGDPNYEYAQYEKAYALEMAERYHEAIQILTELTENPSCSQPLANIYTELGNCYDNLEDYEKAVAYYDKGLETNPYYFHLHFNKGVSLMRQEKYAEALQNLDVPEPRPPRQPFPIRTGVYPARIHGAGHYGAQLYYPHQPLVPVHHSGSENPG